MATRLESGPAKTDTMWVLGFTLLCLGWGAWSFYDWKVGYPEKNRVEAAGKLTDQMKQLSPPQLPPNPLAEKPRKADFDALVKSEQRAVDSVNEILGPPLFERSDAGVVTRYYASEHGMASIPFRGGMATVTPGNWQNWIKSEDDIQVQMYMGVGCVLLGAFFAFRAYKAATLHVTIDEHEMKYGGTRIPVAAMTRLAEYSPKGLVNLYYDAGGERKLRLDNQKVAKFDEIIDTICAIKGFPDPRTAEDGKESEPAN